MSARSYWGLWAILVFVTVGLFVTANLTWLSITVVGFVACLFIFMGMICVTPTVVGPHATEFQHGDAEPIPEKKAQTQRVHELVSMKVGHAR